MSVNVEMSSIFGRYTDNKLNIEVKGSTTGECLHDLVRQFPDLERMLLDKTGKLSHRYALYVNGESAYPIDMARPVKDGDKINIIYVIHGG